MFSGGPKIHLSPAWKLAWDLSVPYALFLPPLQILHDVLCHAWCKPGILGHPVRRSTGWAIMSIFIVFHAFFVQFGPPTPEVPKSRARDLRRPQTVDFGGDCAPDSGLTTHGDSWLRAVVKRGFWDFRGRSPST